MSKRLVCLIAFVLMLICTTAYAAEPNNVPTAVYEIISPKINANGDVIKEQHLLISLRLNQAIDANVTLTRLDEPRAVVASEAAKRLRQIALAAPDAPVSQSNDSGNNLDPIAVVTRKDVLADETSHEIVREAFYKSGQELMSAYEDYQAAYANARKSLDAERLNHLITQRRLLQSNLKSLHYARQGYEKSASIYLQLSNKFEALYRVKVVNKAPIVVQGVLPIFNLTVKDIQIGKYELVVENADTGKRIGDKVTFIVKDKENAAVEIIERVKDQMNGIFKTD